MAKQTKTFSCGHEVPVNFDQEHLELVGGVSILNNLDPISYEAEVTELYPGMQLYYYYEEKTFQYISAGNPPKARFQYLCENCLLNTLFTEEPHYGDGIYFTQHSQLFDKSTHREVIRSHGIPYRQYRATYVCMNDSVFRKIYKTGGVLRSCVHKIEEINETNMVSLEDGVVFPLCLGW